MYLKHRLKSYALFDKWRVEQDKFATRYIYPVLTLEQFIKQHKPCPMHNLCDYCMEVLKEAEQPLKK